MNMMDRDLGLALLKQLLRRELISTEIFIAACHSHYFDRKNFTDTAKTRGGYTP